MLENMKSLPVGKIALGVVGLFLALDSFTIVGSGETVRIQNNITGGHTWKTTEGIALKMPFASSTVTYSQEGTVAITDNEELCDTATICALPRQVSFADTYGITLEASFRYSLPKDDVNLEKMHDKVKNSNNLFGTTLLPFSQDLVNYTASQFKAEDFTQGAQNEFKLRMIDQATGGMFVTKREKIIIETEAANRDTARDSGKANVGEQFTYKVVIVEGEDGLPKRNPTAIAAYGINIVPSGINLVDYRPEQRLQQFMVDKQDRVRDRAKIIEQQENERQMAITAQLKGDRERIEKQNILLQQKDAAKIAGEKAVVEAKLQAERETVERQKVADLAIIDKQRELQIAKDNENIQKANSVAAKYEAQAIKEVGFAKAEVEKAQLNAKQSNKDIYLAELEREINLAKYAALKEFKVQMPNYVSMGGEGKLNSSLVDMSNMVVLDKLETKLSGK